MTTARAADPGSGFAELAARWGDVEAAAAIAARDIRVTMPPYPMCFDGIDGLRPNL